ncbi:MAG TPA: hypothetical protein PKD55_15085 [Bellilinea sp.]|nr:hypothetical protein [Bellilinea sp.]
MRDSDPPALAGRLEAEGEDCYQSSPDTSPATTTAVASVTLLNDQREIFQL